MADDIKQIIEDMGGVVLEGEIIDESMTDESAEEKELTVEILDCQKHPSGLVLITTARVTDGETVKQVSFTHKSLPFTEDGVINALKCKFYEPEPEIPESPSFEPYEPIKELELTEEEIIEKEKAEAPRKAQVDAIFAEFQSVEKVIGPLSVAEIDAVEEKIIEEPEEKTI